ncbi:hypothetical protein M8J76_014175 [Diaphorina citri]|nr:hypothetical protein M8J75_003399 [Diaphorina citri]KAI5750263.1 hypothetical protein M8J76_014175 [Diaphorina citri]KAI5753980.1 hypothetical protein M8J77_004792 [Diaphorina citri]
MMWCQTESCLLLISSLVLLIAEAHEHIPPGINPNTYKVQAHHQQQFQHGAPPPPNQPHHGHHGEPKVLAGVQDMSHEREHIQEHFDVPIDTSKMSEQELQFHYFKMHDADNNNKLDGCELIKSLIHWHEHGQKDPHTGEPTKAPEPKVFSDEELVKLIDPILNMDDINKDGYIDYPEFIRAQSKANGNKQ